MTGRAKAYVRWLALVAFVSSLAACGGGGGDASAGSAGGAGSGGDTGSSTPGAPLIETWVADSVLEPTFTLTVVGDKLYASTEFGLVELDGTTGTKRTVAGNTLFSSDATGEGAEVAFTGVVADSRAYVGLRRGRVGIVNRTPDAATAIELSPPQRGLQLAIAPNFTTISANSTRTFWVLMDGRGNSLLFQQQAGQPVSSAPLFSARGEFASLAATDSDVYLYVDNVPDSSLRRVFRYNLSTAQAVLLYEQTRAVNVVHTDFPIIADAHGAYWANGGEVLFVAHGATAVRSIVTVGGLITALVSDGSSVYAGFAQNATLEQVIAKIDPATGARTDLVRLALSSIQSLSFAVLGAQLYFAVHWMPGSGSGTTIYRVEGAGNSTAVLDATATYGFSGAQAMAAGAGKLVITGFDPLALGSRLLIYDEASATATVLRPATRVNHLSRWASKVYFAGFTANVGISQLDLTRPPRAIEEVNTLDPAPGGFAPVSGTGAGGVLYFVGRFAADRTTPWRLVRMQPDGSGYETLAQASGELRDPVVIGNRVYFLCRDSCGGFGWIINSVPISGGVVSVEFRIGDEPRLYGRSGFLYLAQTGDGQTGDVFAIDPATRDVSVLLSDIPYASLTLAFSDTWLYWAGEGVLASGAPNRAVARHRWVSASSVGPQQIIVQGMGETVSDLFPGSIAAGNRYLYYWHSGLKRVPE